MNEIVQNGISQIKVEYDSANASLESLSNELALLALGDVIPLDFKIDTDVFMKEISAYESEWVDYLPRPHVHNNRKSLALTNLPGKTHRDNPSQAQAIAELGRVVTELEFNTPTDVYKTCTSLHPFLEEFSPLGRSFLLNCGAGGYFLPHRDHPTLPRNTFRLVAFLNNCAPMQYDWIFETDKKIQIEEGRVYYVNTRKTHRTMSWVSDSIHLITCVPMTSTNVSKVLKHLQHRH